MTIKKRIIHSVKTYNKHDVFLRDFRQVTPTSPAAVFPFHSRPEITRPNNETHLDISGKKQYDGNILDISGRQQYYDRDGKSFVLIQFHVFN